MPTAKPTRSAWCSKSGVTHVDLECRGLDRMREAGTDPADKLTERYYRQLRDLVDLVSGWGTSLCRICAVEPVLTDLLTHGDPRERQVFVTFTISRPADQATRQRKYGNDERSMELARMASERLLRIAAASGLDSTPTPAGQAAYGFVPTSMVRPIGKVVRAHVRDSVTELPASGQISAFWSLVRDADTNPSGNDPWFVAELLFAPAAG